MVIHIKNLRLQAVIGVLDWERKLPQDIVVNVKVYFDGTQAAATDDIEEALDYDTMVQRVIKEVEHSRFHLLEKLAQHILSVIMEDPRVEAASIEVDKPNALQLADSVSVFCEAKRAL